MKKGRKVKSSQNKTIINSIVILVIIILIVIGIEIIKNVKKAEEEITMAIYLEFDISDMQKDEIEKSIEKSKYINSFKYISSEEGAEEMRQKLTNKNLLDGIADLLPEKFLLKVKCKYAETVDNIYTSMDGVKSVSYNEERY